MHEYPPEWDEPELPETRQEALQVLEWADSADEDDWRMIPRLKRNQLAHLAQRVRRAFEEGEYEGEGE